MSSKTVNKWLIGCLVLAVFFTACKDLPKQDEVKSLPYLGFHDFKKRTNEYGDVVTDTIHHMIPSFEFLNQDSVLVSSQKYDGHIYIADFFFTKCPTICPKKTSNLHEIQDKLSEEGMLGDVLIASFTVDPESDSLSVLRNYAEVRDIDTEYWDFIYGSRSRIYDLAAEGYMISVSDKEDVIGGILHTDAFVLVDRKGRVRGVYDGTDTPDNLRLLEEIKLLIDEH